MYELTRVRLHSVGPSAARYHDVVLDLRDVGLRITPTTQESLFPSENSEIIRRPSPASVLFLENGGGKSVLIKLIFSVVLPGRRQVVGTTNTRVLENFVRAKDVSHVVLEWQHTLTGARVVTGKVSEWRGHVVSSDPSKLADAWYSFRPTGSFTLDTLPLTRQGRLLTLSGFHDRLLEAHREAPELQLVWERGHSDWTEHLNSLGIDAELFRYQRAMNAGEGEAADAFSFKTDEAFVDFLLRAVTAEEDPRGLADVLDNYATRLAQRGGLQAERDFVVGALELLEPLAQQESGAVAARQIAATARAEGERFAAEVATRHAREVDLLATLRAHFAEVSEQEQEADQEQRRRGAIVLELRRLVTQLRLRAAEKVKEDLAERLRAEQLRLDAWRETAVEIRFQAATEKVTRLAAIVSEQEGRAKPALAARDRAAQRLVRGLLWLAEQADEAAAQADGEAQACAEQADRVQADHDTTVGDLQQQLAVKNAADERIAQARQDVSEQVRAGLLDEGADVAGAAQRARAAEDSATHALAEALAKLTELRNAHDVAVNALMAAERAASEADHGAQRATTELDLANARAAQLISAARLADLLGSEDIVLDTDTPVLLERLDDAIRTAEDERASLRAASLEDERALRALGTGGLLPPPEDVARALDVLEEEGITAWSGWQYLANVAPEEREATLTRFPHLVGGVVLNNATEYERAEGVLAQARLLPRSVVAIGDTAAMLRLDMAPPHGIGLLVPPNPAMYDEAEAETERQAIAARHGQRQERLRMLTEQVAADRALTATLQAWQRDYRPGEVDRLTAAKAEADAARSEANRLVADTRRAEEEPRTEESRLRQDLPNLAQREAEARQRAQLLTGLADLVARIPQWTQESSTAGQLAEKARERAEEARDRARMSRRRSGEYTRAADDHRRTASSCRDELRKVPGAGSVTAQDVVPTEPVEALRQAHESAAADYEKVRVGSDLLGELQVAQQVEAEARAALESVPAAVRAIVLELLRGPDGADEPARSAATARAQRAVHQYGAELGEANANVGALRSEFQRMARQSRSLEPYGAPKDIEHGERLIERATADWDAARTAHDKVDATKGELDAKVTAAARVVDGFQGLVDTLTDLAPELPEPDLAPWHGSLDDARQAHRAVRDNLTNAAQRLSTAEKAVRQSADRLAGYAADPRFEKVDSHVRRQLVSVGREQLPGYAQEWDQALRPRLRTLNDDLGQIERHRSNIVARMKGMVESALSTLRAAQRLSRLPEGLADWSGQEFLRIKFDDIEEDLLLDRLGEVVDEAVDQPGSGQTAKRDGVTLLLRGVRAAMPKGVRVEMLKPDAVLRTERVRVSEIRDVFSGGQQLTAAIILYCTMAALRANDRGHSRRRHAGVLFLDNPIGRASAGYLLDLQLHVAQALGVQLIYTTGLFDTEALSVFPLIIRLRNDADLRAGLKYLALDSQVRRPLEQLGEPDGTGRLSATRLFARPV